MQLLLTIGILIQIGAQAADSTPIQVGLQATDSTQYDYVLYVDQRHERASNVNPGTFKEPFQTIRGGVERAVQYKKAGRSVRVVIYPGVYREGFEFGWTNWETNDPENDTPILIEAAQSGTVVLSGSDIWTDWELEGNAYVHKWLYNWEQVENPWAEYREMEPIVLRREMIFVNRKRMLQVLSKQALEPGSFYLDDEARKMYLIPPAGLDLNQATVEVALREKLWWQEYENNVTVRGIVFQHAATRWADAWGGVRISGSKNVRFEDDQFIQNNGIGFLATESQDVVLHRVTMNHNGWDGWGTWRVNGFYAEDTETSYNNWRGAMGGFDGWSVGNKLESTHGMRIRRHRAVGNHSRGLWLDYDIQDAVLEDLDIRNNDSDGIWIEANPGPITLRNSLVCGNGGNGLMTTYSENVTVVGNRFLNNKQTQILIAGEGDRWVKDFVSDEGRALVVKNWTITDNTAVGGTAVFGTDAQFGLDEWNRFRDSSQLDHNTWFHPSRRDVFQLQAGGWMELLKKQSLSLEEWRDKTGFGKHSTFAQPGQLPACE